MIAPAEYDVILESKICQESEVCVVITCYNYGYDCIEALDSLTQQTETHSVIIVDDASTDQSLDIITRWAASNDVSKIFASFRLISHKKNQGLSQSRNTGISLTKSPYIFILDADNQLYPKALEELKNAIKISGYAMSYSIIEKFGDEIGILNNQIWEPELFAYGNYIDAMAMIKREILEEIGGYRKMPDNFGWEDYDLWCSMVDRGYRGCYVPKILCRYRVRGFSMLNSLTNKYLEQNYSKILKFFQKNHPNIDFKFKI